MEIKFSDVLNAGLTRKPKKVYETHDLCIVNKIQLLVFLAAIAVLSFLPQIALLLRVCQWPHKWFTCKQINLADFVLPVLWAIASVGFAEEMAAGSLYLTQLNFF